MSNSDQALRWIGDLDHPFYDDERQRFIWYEASAIGFQLFLFANIGALGVAVWIGGAHALPYVLPFFMLQLAMSFVAIGYAKRKHAEYVPEAADFATGRMTTYLALLAFLMAGIGRALWQLSNEPWWGQDRDGFVGGFVEGAQIGAWTALLAISVGIVVAFVKSRSKSGL